MNIHTIGIDLGKTSFHLAGLNERGELVVRKHFSRTQLHCASLRSGRCPWRILKIMWRLESDTNLDNGSATDRNQNLRVLLTG